MAILRSLLQSMPELELWLDAGFASAGAAEALRAGLGAAGQQVVAVFGSESLASRAELERCFAGTNVAGTNAAAQSASR